MRDLTFEVEGVAPQRHTAEPVLVFRLRVTDTIASAATLVHAIVLRCQLRIEPARRRYSDAEKGRLLDLFGTPERWGQTVRPMPWAQVTTVVPPFTGSGSAELDVPCSFDFNLAATKYFAALDDGDLPLCLLFSGTIFYEADGALQVAPIPWQCEAYFRLPAATWRELMDSHYPDGTWLRLRKDVFDRLNEYRSGQGLPTWDQTVERLLPQAEEAVTR